MYPTPRFTALRVALLFSLSLKSKTRARITAKTFRLLSERERIHASFETSFRDELEELGTVAIPLGRGGFGLISTSILEGAPLLTIKANLRERAFHEGKSWKQLDENDIWNLVHNTDYCEQEENSED